MGILGAPLGWIMWAIDQVLHNYGWSLIVFVLITKLITFPLAVKQQKSTVKMSGISAKQKALQKKYGNDKNKLNEETMKLYEQEGINPMGGCLPLVVQMVLLFGIIDVIYRPLTHLVRVASDKISAATALLENGMTAMNEITIINEIQKGSTVFDSVLGADLIAQIKNFDLHFLGMNLGELPTFTSILIIIPILSGVTALLSSWISMKIQGSNGQQMGNGMKLTMLLMPLVSVLFAFTMPSGAGLYWTVGNVFQIVQTIVIQKIWPPEKILAEKNKNAAKTSEKFRRRRERMEAYNATLEEVKKERGITDDPVVTRAQVARRQAEQKLAQRNAAMEDENASPSDKEEARRRIAAARKRMAEKYGEEYTEE